MANDARERIVFDINTLVSGYLFPQSIPGQALGIVLSRHLLLMSIEVAAELTDVMRREKFDRYLSRLRRDELVASTIRDSRFIETSTTVADCRDPDDNKLLELAIDGNAAMIVSGDADLLALNPFQNIAIVTPREFVARFPAN